MAGMKAAGKPLGIDFDYNCYINRQPIDSQRMLLYAARHGLQEQFMSCLNKRHFERGSHGESASKRHTVLAAAKEAGLDYDAAAAFYDSDELREQVWKSYGEMPRRGIDAIPLFVFNVPEIGLEGGPLRPPAATPGAAMPGAAKPPIVNGSMTPELFERIFDELWDQVEAHRRKAKLAGAAPAAPPATTGAAATTASNGAPGAARKAAPKPSTLTSDAPLVGCRVVLRGLAARPELNGRLGTAGKFDTAKGRYAVRLLDGPSEPLSIKPANLDAGREAVAEAVAEAEAAARSAKAAATTTEEEDDGGPLIEEPDDEPIMF